MNTDFDDLAQAAATARYFAYAPYSGFKVGAALRCTSGAVIAGCNVENVSFGLTVCAERISVGVAVAQGETKFEAIAIIVDAERPVMPCGACRQVLAEFNPDLLVWCGTLSGRVSTWRLTDLLPEPALGFLQPPRMIPRGT